jgi:hypothetical protein
LTTKFKHQQLEVIAKILGDNCIEQDSKLMTDFVDYFKDDNPRFQEQRFRDAVKRHCLIKMGS